MSISIKDFDSVNYDSLQSIFMNIPYKEYISYIYPKIGCSHMLPEISHFINEVCRCDERYIINFEIEKTDDNMTVGQLLRIATLTMSNRAEELYSGFDVEKISAIGVKIVELLIIVPFGKFALGNYQFRNKYDVRDSESYIQSLTKINDKERKNNG